MQKYDVFISYRRDGGSDAAKHLRDTLTELGYSAKTFHYNDPSFYSRGEFSPAMGYEEYVC